MPSPEALTPADIVESGLCIGCGGCATRGMTWDRYGQRKPSTATLTDHEAGHAPPPAAFAATCPFSPAARDEDQLALARFPAAGFHLQDRDITYATGRCMCNGMLRHPFSVEHVTTMVKHVYGERVTFHSGDGEVAPGVTVHRVGGHSDGLQVVRVETARGPVVLASDAAHYYANLQKRSPFPIVYNVGDMAQGWETVERLAGHPDRFIPGHDPLVSEIYPSASDKVDAFALHLAPSRSFAK